MYLLGGRTTIVCPGKSSKANDSDENTEEHYVTHFQQGRPTRACRCKPNNYQRDRSRDGEVHR